MVALTLLAGRATYLSTVRAGELASLAADQQLRDYFTPAPRGPILSSDGSELAVGRQAYDVSATPYQVEDPATAATRLAPLLRRPRPEVLEKLTRRDGYALLARNVDPIRAERIRDLELAGIDMKESEERYYPHRRLAAQVIGLTDTDGRGLTGIEQEMDTILTGRAGSRVEVHDALGRALRVAKNDEAQPGRAIRLTINAAIQDRVERILAETRDRYGAKSATAVVMRPSDGAIIAMATVPRFDPNNRGTATADRQRNRPVTDLLEPGSTFKIVTIAGVLEEGLATPSTMLRLPAVLHRYDRDLVDAHERGPETWSVGQILARSSNIGTVLLAESLGQRRLQEWIGRFGFGRLTGVDYPGESPGLVLRSDQWSGTSILNIPIGQGIATTQLQMTRAFAVIANGGRMVTPHLIARIGGSDVRHPPGARVISEGTAATLNNMLRNVVKPDGTGSEAAVAGYDVAGKTGTSNKLDPESGGYSTRFYWASFVGYLPANDPQLVISVVVDEPGGSFYGGEVAAPAFRRIATFSLHQLGISP